MSKGISLYIHIPFCKTKCSYCDFASFEGKGTIKKAYIDALLIEVRSYQKLKINTIFFGGGTPSTLSPDEIGKIISSVDAHHFIENDAEISMEINPIGGSKEYIKKIKSYGVNRLSIGVQSFNQSFLKKLGRTATPKEAKATVENAKKAGFSSISIDLMFGLPSQTINSLKEDIKLALQFEPEHLSYYQLTPEEGTVLNRDIKKGEVELPDDEITFQMYNLVGNRLQKNRYNHYEISNYAKSGYECLHNLAYWHGDDYIGIGSSAHSFFKGVRFANDRLPESYIKNQKNGIKVNGEKQGNLSEKIVEFLLMRLRLLNEEIKISYINQRFKIDFFNDYNLKLERLKLLGLIDANMDSIKLTRKGELFLNNLLLEFL